MLLLGKKHTNVLTVALLLAALSVFLAYVTRLNCVTHDLYHAMALARYTLETGSFPQNDVFAFTPTMQPTVHHEWGFGLIAYLTTGNSWGAALLMSLKFLLIATMFLCAYRVCRQRGGDPAFFALGVVLILPFFWVGFATIRAQLFTLTAISIQLVMMEADWRGKRGWVAVWLLLLGIWLNVHAGFVIGAGLMAFHGLERILSLWCQYRSLKGVWRGTWHLLVAAPFAVGLLFANPYGTEYVTYLLHGLTMPRPLIAEWAPLWETYEPLQTMLAFAVSVALIGYSIKNRQWSRLRGVVFLVLCALMAVKHIRHGSIYGLIWLAYVPAWLSCTPLADRLRNLLTRKQELLPQFSVGIMAICLGFALWHPFWKAYLPVTAANERGNYPLGAVEYLQRNNFTGKLITDFDAGAYVTWELFPHVLVSLDGRYEAAFQPGVLEEHLELLDAKPKWGKWLDHWKADGILVPSGSKLGKVLAPLAGSQESHEFPGSAKRWKCTYSDPGTMIWVEEQSQLPSEISQELPADKIYNPS